MGEMVVSLTRSRRLVLMEGCEFVVVCAGADTGVVDVEGEVETMREVCGRVKQ